MIPGMDPKKLQQALKQMGMKMDNIPADKVIIKTQSGDITIEEPQVIKTSMKGQVIFQVSGKVKEKTFSEDDVKLAMEQSGIKDEKKVRKTLEKSNGDIVEAIMKLKGG